MPQSLSLKINTSDVLKVRLENPKDLWGIDVRLTYDATIVECTNPPDKGSVPQPDIVAKVSCANGMIEYIATQQAPTTPANTSGDVILPRFKCLKAGTTPVNFTRAKLVDRDGQNLALTTVNGQITCSDTITPTVTPSPTPATVTPTPPPSGILGYHVVRAGETVFCIARAYGVSPWSIVSQNGLIYPYWPNVGQSLAIPNVPYQVPPGPVCARQFGSGGATVVPPPPPPVPRCRVFHLVRYGDTLSSIAWRYGSTVNRIVSANGLYNPNWIWAGQCLCVP